MRRARNLGPVRFLGGGKGRETGRKSRDTYRFSETVTEAKIGTCPGFPKFRDTCRFAETETTDEIGRRPGFPQENSRRAESVGAQAIGAAARVSVAFGR